LAKKYHPDSGSPDADTEKFQQIEAAFRKLREKFWLERKKANEVGGEFGLFHEDKEKVEVVDQDIKVKIILYHLSVSENNDLR
jgi:DnaJ-class molecular chaperone with C-terminal Zn finger domain